MSNVPLNDNLQITAWIRKSKDELNTEVDRLYPTMKQFGYNRAAVKKHLQVQLNHTNREYHQYMKSITNHSESSGLLPPVVQTYVKAMKNRVKLNTQ